MVLVPPFHPPMPFQKTPVAAMLKQYLDKGEQRCLSTPAILVLPLVCLFSAKRYLTTHPPAPLGHAGPLIRVPGK